MILVTGPMGSGTRLLARLLTASGAPAEHDTSHGCTYRGADNVVAIVRDPRATAESRGRLDVHGEWPTRRESLVGIATLYPFALWVTYEQLCADPDGTIAYLAPRLGLEPWVVDEVIESRNPVVA